jgi:hypothetical protein
MTNTPNVPLVLLNPVNKSVGRNTFREYDHIRVLCSYSLSQLRKERSLQMITTVGKELKPCIFWIIIMNKKIPFLKQKS